ncbi:hypothetical protein J6590_011638 [Homalodisca vitripennis]|nr:hypothetical protein J6590_011638 [Homalodisca vitripennis]
MRSNASAKTGQTGGKGLFKLGRELNQQGFSIQRLTGSEGQAAVIASAAVANQKGLGPDQQIVSAVHEASCTIPAL